MSIAELDPATQDYVLTTSNGLARTTHTTLQSVSIRLATQRGSCLWDLQFGSRLHQLPQHTLVATIEATAEAYVREALQPMVDAGELQDLVIQAARVDRNRLDLVLSARDAGRRPLSFQTFVRLA